MGHPCRGPERGLACAVRTRDAAEDASTWPQVTGGSGGSAQPGTVCRPDAQRDEGE